jgi:nicotinate-nucleotide adenylyltransferase
MRIGIFGGTFDPPHIGHQILASQAYDELQLDRVLWVLTHHPPHKIDRRISSIEDRIDMVLATIDDNPAFEFSRIDIDRLAPQYAADTVRLLRGQYPDAELAYLVGGDSLRDLPSWYHPRALVQTCDEIGVMVRPGSKLEVNGVISALPEIEAKLRFIHSPLLDISSSDIRTRVAAGNTFRYFLPEKVYRLVVERSLYQAVEPEDQQVASAKHCC